MFMTAAPTAGSGKSFLSDLSNTIVRGKKCSVITAAESKEELEKRLGALIEGVQIVALDSCSHHLGGDYSAKSPNGHSSVRRIMVVESA